MRVFVLFENPQVAQNPRMPNKDQHVIRILHQLISDDAKNPRASIGDMEEGVLVYVPWYQEVCLGTGFNEADRTCRDWWVVSPPYELEGNTPYNFRLFGPILDTQLLDSLPAEVALAFPREPAAESA